MQECLLALCSMRGMNMGKVCVTRLPLNFECSTTAGEERLRFARIWGLYCRIVLWLYGCIVVLYCCIVEHIFAGLLSKGHQLQ